MFKTLTCKTCWNKVQFGSCCCRANTSCEAKQIPNDFQKHHPHRQRPKTHSWKMLFSMKTFSTVNETCPDMMASCSFPENTKNNDLYLVRRRDLAKTNLITSASYLDTNSRVKCSMHSSPNIVTAHRVYPYTFIPPLAVTLQEYIDHAVCISLSRKSTSKGIESRPLHQKYIWSTVEFNQIASPIPFQLQWTLKTSL